VGAARDRSHFFIITHNIQSVMRTAEYMGVLFRSNLVKFASKQDMLATDNPIIQQFLAGRPEGPTGMDGMADAGGDTSRYIEGDTAALQFGPLPRPGESALTARAVRPARPAGVARGAQRRRPQSPAASPHTVSMRSRLTT
jgi:phospholipid/cholesterol/gamma-HCH transport system ATP-binding protein